MKNPAKFIEQLKNLELINIQEKSIKRINQLGLNNGHTYDGAKKYSLACAALYQYLKTVYDLWNYQKPMILLEQKKQQLVSEIGRAHV